MLTIINHHQVVKDNPHTAHIFNQKLWLCGTPSLYYQQTLHEHISISFRYSRQIAVLQHSCQGDTVPLDHVARAAPHSGDRPSPACSIQCTGKPCQLLTLYLKIYYYLTNALIISVTVKMSRQTFKGLLVR